MEVFCYLEAAEIGGVIFNETAKQQTFCCFMCPIKFSCGGQLIRG